MQESLEVAVAFARLENRNTKLEAENELLRAAVDDMNAVCEAAWKEMERDAQRDTR